MSDTATLAQQVYQQVLELPEESLWELSRYLEFLRFKAHTPATAPTEWPPSSPPLRIVKLRGIWEGYDFSPEFIAQARREMWHKFGEIA